MPIFSNRDIAALLREISPKLSKESRNSILSRLIRGGDDAIATEWEIAVFACLTRTGEIEFLPKRQGLSDPDVLYTSKASGERMIIEITAISDQGLHDQNAVQLFTDMLYRETKKLKGASAGTFRFQLGYVKKAKKIVLGIPEKKDMEKFFKGSQFCGFVKEITSNPGTPHQMRFECRGATSTLDFQPRAQLYGGGGHIAFELMLDIEKNHFFNRLHSKDDQIKSAVLGLPSIVILCDAHCRALGSTLFGPGAPTSNEIIDAFLNGRSFPQFGPSMEPQTHRINAVVVAVAREQRDSSMGRSQKCVDIRWLGKRAGIDVDYLLSDGAINEVANSLLSVPQVRTMPINARNNYPRPRFYGGGETGSRNGRRAVKISLLTLQALLSGQLTHAEFARGHGPLAKTIANYIKEGRMISKIEIEKCSDDDDWAWIEFDEINPNHLFQNLKSRK